MELTVNGEATTSTAATVLELLRSLELDPARVAIELNLAILPKAAYATTPLKSGDRLEIVHFVGGG